MTHIKLDLSVDEVNLILKALGELPFIEVYKLIGKIQDTASGQVNAGQLPTVEP